MKKCFLHGRVLSVFAPALALLSLLLFLAACASPRVPPGGPVDQTPPVLETVSPEAGAVNVEADRVTLVFSEYVDQTSFGRALSITPEPERPPEIAWKGRRAEIRFAEPLRENTTYVITLDTNLRDARNVALRQPLTLAFSTGPEINRGRLAGRVVGAEAGAARAGFDVYAYALPDSAAPDSLPERPAYRTQTDESGRFQLEYLNEQPYFVVAVRDRNRNRRAEAGEAFAVPPRPAIRADTVAASDTLVWVAAAPDATPPEVQRVRPLSARRLALRFTEAVRLVERDPGAWMLEDSAAGRPVVVRAVYQRPAEPRQVFLSTDSMRAVPHRLVVPAVVADSSGNRLRPDTLGFTASADADTLRLRFGGYVPAGENGVALLAPAALPGVRFNASVVPETRLPQIVTLEDTTGRRIDYTATTENGVTYRLAPEGGLAPGAVLVARVEGAAVARPDTVYTTRFRRRSARELGALSGTVVAPADSAAGPILVELYRTDDEAAPQPYATVRADTSGAFLFADLPEGPYRFRAFADRNGNGQWDGGVFLPYRPAEPITWSTEAPAWRARWESALENPLRF